MSRFEQYLNVRTASGASFLPDGKHLSFLTDRAEVIYHFGEWSSGGTLITYASNERDTRFFDVYEQPVAAGEPRLLWQHNGSNYARRSSRDGRSVLVERFDSNIRNQLSLVDRATGEVLATVHRTARSARVPFPPPKLAPHVTSIRAVTGRGLPIDRHAA